MPCRGGGPARCHLFPGGGEGTGHRRQAALRARPEVWGIVGSMERNEIIPRARGLRGGLGGGRCGEWASGGAVWGSFSGKLALAGWPPHLNYSALRPPLKKKYICVSEPVFMFVNFSHSWKSLQYYVILETMCIFWPRVRRIHSGVRNSGMIAPC